jgi:hypothetical protein
MNRGKLDLRIGEILTASDILSKADLEQAVKTATSTGLPIGRVLIMAGFLSEIEFQSAVQAQSLVRDSILELETAVRALRLVTDKHIAFSDALKECGFEQTQDRESNKLGELLLAARCVPREKLDVAMRTSNSTGLPLGRLLISLGVISDELLATALNAQTLIRSGRIARHQAILGLTAAHERSNRVERHLADQGNYHGPHRPAIRIGQLFLRSGVLNEAQVDQAIIGSLTKEMYIGEALLEAGLVGPQLLESSLQVQEMVANETLEIESAVHILSQLHGSGCSLPEALAMLDVPASHFKTRVRFIDVLKVAALVDPSETRFDAGRSEGASSADAHRTANELLDDELIDERLYLGALRCYYLIATGFLNMQQGIIALNYFHHKDCSFDDVLRELKWTFRMHIRASNGKILAEESTANV